VRGSLILTGFSIQGRRKGKKRGAGKKLIPTARSEKEIRNKGEGSKHRFTQFRRRRARCIWGKEGSPRGNKAGVERGNPDGKKENDVPFLSNRSGT